MTARRTTARLLRRLAALLDDRRQPPVRVPRSQWEANGGLEASIAKHARRHLRPLPDTAVVTAGYAQGRADLQLTHPLIPAGHEGPSSSHPCRCDSRLAPGLRGGAHPCCCPDPEDSSAHLPPGGPPYITDQGENHP